MVKKKKIKFTLLQTTIYIFTWFIDQIRDHLVCIGIPKWKHTMSPVVPFKPGLPVSPLLPLIREIKYVLVLCYRKYTVKSYPNHIISLTVQPVFALSYHN